LNSNWSDAQLLAHQWRIEGRPDVDTTLSRDKPPVEAVLSFTHEYNVTPAKSVTDRRRAEPYVWCSLCQEATHWVGWVAEYEVDGRTVRTLIGQNCAARKGGEVLRRAATVFKANVDRAGLLQARENVLEVAPHVGRALDDWGTSPGVRVVVEWRAAFEALSPKCLRLVREAAEHSPPTFLIEEVFTQAHTGREVVQYKAFAKIDGAAFYAGAAPTVRIARLSEKFGRAVQGLYPLGLPTRRMRDLLADVRAVADGAREVETTFAGSEKALGDRAIDTAIAWLNRQPREWDMPHELRREARCVVADRGGWQSPTRVDIPIASSIKRPDAFDLLERALLGRAREAA
jgi:hypothetical protein